MLSNSSEPGLFEKQTYSSSNKRFCNPHITCHLSDLHLYNFTEINETLLLASDKQVWMQSRLALEIVIHQGKRL